MTCLYQLRETWTAGAKHETTSTCWDTPKTTECIWATLYTPTLSEICTWDVSIREINHYMTRKLTTIETCVYQTSLCKWNIMCKCGMCKGKTWKVFTTEICIIFGHVMGDKVCIFKSRGAYCCIWFGHLLTWWWRTSACGGLSRQGRQHVINFILGEVWRRWWRIQDILHASY